MNRRLQACAVITSLAVVSASLAGPALATDPAPQSSGIAKPAEQQQHRPNVLVWMLDDVGFAQLSCFGGLVATPNIDRIAARGVRYSNYHTTPICSSSRAALLTGRNSHTVNMGGHNMFAREIPGYNGRIPASVGTLAENLRQAGYRTFALGKWDHLPVRDTSPSGPFSFWPLHQGFDRFYGFVASETDNFHPHLWRDTVPVNPEGKDYHLNNDLADEAIDMIRSRDGEARPDPFMMYWATGTAHAPHHAPREWIERYKGKFDMGWDKAREEILKTQIALGFVPKGMKLAPRPDSMPAWNSLSPDEKRLFARQMEVFAAALSHADAQFGRILDELERRGELDDTVVVIVSDNGASAEGGPEGTFNELYFATGPLPDAEENLKRLDAWGGPETYPHYAFGWAVAGNTPNRYFKQTTYEGGIRVPLIVSTPGIGGKAGSWNADFTHVSDVLPSILDIVGVKPAAAVNGVTQSPFDGISVAYTLTGEGAAPASRSQYFEMFGHRAFWEDGWKIVAPSRLNVWDIAAPAKTDSPWQLYNLNSDQGEAVNLSGRNPEKLEELEAGFEAAAARFNINPIAGQRTAAIEAAQRNAADFRARGGKWHYTGPIARIFKQSAPPVDRGDFSVTAHVELDTGTETGPIFALGGHHGGAAFYLKDGMPRFVARSLAGDVTKVSAAQAVGTGRHEIMLSIRPASGGDQSVRQVTMALDGSTILREEIPLSITGVVPESFDVGRDDATSVSDDYAPNREFPGKLDSVTFEVGEGR